MFTLSLLSTCSGYETASLALEIMYSQQNLGANGRKICPGVIFNKQISVSKVPHRPESEEQIFQIPEKFYELM